MNGLTLGFAGVATCALCVSGAFAGVLPPALSGLQPTARWDFGGPTPFTDTVAGRTMTVHEADPGNDIFIDSLTDINGVNQSFLNFVDANDRSYTRVNHDPADQITSGAIAIRGINTGRFNSDDEAIFSKDALNLRGGGDFTVTFIRTSSTTGHIESRLQSATGSQFLITSGPIIATDQFVDLIITFGPDLGYNMYLDRDLSDGTAAALEASSSFTGGLENNTQPWIFGSSRVFSSPVGTAEPINPSQLRGGLSGGIASVQIFEIPTPGSIAMLGAGGLLLARRRR